jgi:hypothetical protein
MNTENLLLILKIKQITKYLALEDIIELSSTCKIIFNQLKSNLQLYFGVNSYFNKNSYYGDNFNKFEIAANSYVLKNSKFIKYLNIGVYHPSYMINLNWKILNTLSSIYLNCSIKLSELNKLLNSSENLVKLTLSEVEVVDNLDNSSGSSCIHLPKSLIDLNIYSLAWLSNPFNIYSVSNHKEYGVYLFGNNMILPKLRSLAYYEYFLAPESLLNYLLSKSPNLTKFKGGGEIFNQDTYKIFNTKYPLLSSVSLIFPYSIPVSMEALSSCRFDSQSELMTLKSTVCDNTFHTYIICKSFPHLTELTLEWNIISMQNLNHLLSLLPEIKKLSLISYTKEIDIKGLKFYNSSVTYLSLNKIFSLSLRNIIEILNDWTQLNHISISKSSNQFNSGDVEELKLDFMGNSWVCYSYKKCNKIWKL